MKQIKNMSQVELAAFIQDSLQKEGIQVRTFRRECGFFL